MCRMCLVQNVRMHVVVNKGLQDLYEKLTNIPFVTEDNRPMLACFFCYVKLKQCCQLQRKCLEAERLFAQMMNKQNPLINQGQLEFFGGFIKTATENISIVDVGQNETIVVKEELPAVCERQDDIIQPKEEYQTYEIELKNEDNCSSDVEDISAHHAESDSKDEEPLMEVKTEVEDEQESTEIELKNEDYCSSDVEDIPAHHAESDSKDDEPLMVFKTEIADEQESTGPSGVKYLSRKDIYDVVESSQEPYFGRKLNFMEETLISKFCKDEDQKKDWKQKLSLIKHQFKSRWHAAHKRKDLFKKNNNDWLDGMTSLRLPLTETRTGRPDKIFTESSERSKRRKT